MGRDSATLDIGIEVPSLSRDKGKMRQAQNLAMRRNGPRKPVKIQDGTITIFLSKFRAGQGRDGTIKIFSYDFLFHNIFSCFRTSFSVLECPFLVLERPSLFFSFFLGK